MNLVTRSINIKASFKVKNTFNHKWCYTTLVKKEDLHWTDKDTQAVIQYKEDVNSGRINPVKLNGEAKELFSN